MAQYGAKGLRWAKVESDKLEDALPIYAGALPMGPLVAVTDSITYAEGKNYGDNALEEYINEFQELAVDAEVTELPMLTAKELFGAVIDEEGNLRYSRDDVSPDGGLAFYVTKQIKENGIRKIVHQGVMYPKLKASRQGATYNTKGSSISFANGKAHFAGGAAANGEYQIVSDYFDTEAEAVAWLDKHLPLANPA